MDRRGATSFVILLVLNPIVILFFQNCSLMPTETPQSSLQASRQISSSASVEPENLCRLVSVSQSCAE